MVPACAHVCSGVGCGEGVGGRFLALNASAGRIRCPSLNYGLDLAEPTSRVFGFERKVFTRFDSGDRGSGTREEGGHSYVARGQAARHVLEAEKTREELPG